MYKLKRWLYPVFTLICLVSILVFSNPSFAVAASDQPVSSYEDKEFKVDENASASEVSEYPSIFGLLVRLVISVAVIGGLTVVTMKFLRRNLQPQSEGQFINVLDQYAMGVNRGIYVTEVADQVLVLGVTEHSISVLGTIENTEIIEEMRTQMLLRQNSLVTDNTWSGYLGKMLGNTRKQVEFKAHIQEQIQKLQSINLNITKRGKDDEGV